MKRKAFSPVRVAFAVGGFVLLAAFMRWQADRITFRMKNRDAIVFCDAAVAGTPVSAVLKRARDPAAYAVAGADASDRLVVVRFKNEKSCVVEVEGDRVRSAAVLTTD